MSTIIVNGGRSLNGEIQIQGAKNAILPILAASIMTEEPIVIHNCPRLTDVHNMLHILNMLGCEAVQSGRTIRVDASRSDSYEMPTDLSKQLRSSIFMLGALITRFERAWVTQPGGCDIGMRPIDLHLKGLRELNVQIIEEHGAIHCVGRDVRGADITLDYPSVGATENIIMAAVKAKGKTIIRNAAREPEVSDLANFINAMGGDVRFAGTGTIEIHGVEHLHGTEYSIIPDRIVAGTYMAAAAMTGGELRLKGAVQDHLTSISSKLVEAGCDIRFHKDEMTICGPARPQEMKRIETLPFPGFPTDIQAPVFAVACIADGTSVIMENVFENRFRHASELTRMGADISINDRSAVVRGVERLQGAAVTACELRGGAALVLAGLAAKGQTVVEKADFISRGYEDIVSELTSVGADIRRFD